MNRFILCPLYFQFEDGNGGSRDLYLADNNIKTYLIGNFMNKFILHIVTAYPSKSQELFYYIFLKEKDELTTPLCEIFGTFL